MFRASTCPSSGGQIVLSQHLVSSLSVDGCTVCQMRADCSVFHYRYLTYFPTCWFIYVFTPWSRVLPEELTGSQLVNKFPAFNGTRRFITAFTKASHFSLSWARLMQSMSPFHFMNIHLVLSSYRNMCLPSVWYLSLRFPHQIPVCTSSLPIHATCPAHLIPLDLITRIIFGEEYRSLSFSLCSFPHSPVNSSLLGQYWDLTGENLNCKNSSGNRKVRNL